MAHEKKWSREDLLMAMNLYCKLPFGKINQRTPIIIELAKKMERTPGSLSMKLSNFASLDPIHKARKVKGFSHVSRADRLIWEEFHSNWEKLCLESENLIQELLGDSPLLDSQLNVQGKGLRKPRSVVPQRMQPSGPTEKEMTRQERRGQTFFRQTVLASYGFRCCITANPIPELLVASHILPWSDFPQCRLNPRNGLCLARTQDGAFDRGLITFDEENRLVLSKYIKGFLPEDTLTTNFSAFEGKPFRMPKKFYPGREFLSYHRTQVFLDYKGLFLDEKEKLRSNCLSPYNPLITKANDEKYW